MATRFYRYNGEVSRKILLNRRPVVELLSRGNQTVLPPTIHPETKQAYVWVGELPLLECDIDTLPILEEGLFEKISEVVRGFEFTFEHIGPEVGGRNFTLGRQAYAAIGKGKSDDEVAAELLMYDDQHHKVPLFSDPDEPQMAGRPPGENALRFVRSFRTSFQRKGGVVRDEMSFGPLLSLPRALPVAPPLDGDLVPQAIRGWVEDSARSLQVPLEMIFIPMLVGLGSVVGCRLRVTPKKHDSWYEVPNFWGAVVAPPSWLKTPALQKALGGILELGRTSRMEFVEKLAIVTPILKILDAEERAILKAVEKAVRVGKSTDEFQKRIREIEGERKQLTPKLRTLITNDSTVEKLGELLGENPDGLLMYRDELSGWLFGFSRAGREGEREFFLEAWVGKNSYTVHRISRGTVYVPVVRVAVVGGIQPAKLNLFIEDMQRGGVNADGFFERFQLSVFPEATDWKWVDEPIDFREKERASRVFEILANYNFSEGTSIEGPPSVGFSTEAQEVFQNWLTELERRLRHPDVTEFPYLESTLGKYRGLMPKLALMYELIAWADERVGGSDGRASHRPPNISLASTEKALKLCDFLEVHARKILAIAKEPGIQEAHELAKHITRGEFGDGDTVRTIHRHHWRHLSDIDRVEAGLSVLERMNWIKVMPEKTGGRDRDLVRLHPDLRKRSAKGAESSLEPRSSGTFGTSSKKVRKS